MVPLPAEKGKISNLRLSIQATAWHARYPATPVNYFRGALPPSPPLYIATQCHALALDFFANIVDFRPSGPFTHSPAMLFLRHKLRFANTHPNPSPPAPIVTGAHSLSLCRLFVPHSCILCDC